MGEADALGSGTGGPHGPVTRPVACATCGGPVDPLRAARVAIIRERFRYYCSAECRDRFDAVATQTPLPVPRRQRVTPRAGLGIVAVVPEAQRQAAVALASVGGEAHDLGARFDPLGEVTAEPSDLDDRARDVERPQPTDDPGAAVDVGSLLLAFAVFGGVLAFALELAGDSPVALGARVVVVVVALGSLFAQYVMGPRESTELHPMALLAAPAAAVGIAIFAYLLHHGRASGATTLGGLVVACAAANIWLARRARRPTDAEREELIRALAPEQPARRVVGDSVTQARAGDLRPGEEIVVETGETVPADVTVTAGDATVLPWLGAKTPVPRTEGHTVVAGARVLEGRLRAVVGWSGYDRAWVRLVADPRRRADVLAPLARAGRLVAERGAPCLAVFAAVTAFAGNHDIVGIAMAAVAAQAALASPGIAQVGALRVAHAVFDALRRGIAFRTADALDRAGKVSSVVFCARGTLLLGEPEVANIEAVGNFEPHDVLAMVAGAESGANHPVATAVLRAARARSVRPDGVRSPNVQAGLGVTAIASNGQPLVVGSRALMLRERISVAMAEQRIIDFEAMGRSVLLVALGGRLIGVVGLQDGLRPGARAAVQHLLDVSVEPVLISGDARETCEALGRALDIEHIRPELLPGERGDEVRRLAESGATVAVVGQSPVDDAALSAADVSIALAAAGSSSAEWSVELASDDVRDAASSIRIAHECRRDARNALAVAIAPSLAAALVVAFGLAPPALAPVAALAGALASLARLKGV